MTNLGDDFKLPPNPNQPRGRRSGCSCSVVTFLATLLVFAVLLVIYNNFAGEKPAPDYPGATRSELTAQGNQFIDNLYQNNKRESSTIKVLLTKDAPQQVLDYYNQELVEKGGFESGKRPTQQLPNAISIAYVKKDRIYVLITSSSEDGFVKDQQSGQTYIIVAQGRS